MYEAIGLLKLTVWIRTASSDSSGRNYGRRLTLLREYCRREEAEDRIKAFRALNPQFCDGLGAFWQAEQDAVRTD